MVSGMLPCSWWLSRAAPPPGNPRCLIAALLPSPWPLLASLQSGGNSWWTLGMREGSFSSSHLDSWCQSRHCPGWRREGMNEQRSNETVCVEALCKQRCGTHMRVGDYGLYTCRAGALPGTEQELGRTFGNRGWTAEGSRRWRPGPPGSTGSGGIRVRCSLGRALVNRPRGRRGRKWDQLRRKGDVMLLAA